MSGLPEKRKPGRPPGSTNKCTTLMAKRAKVSKTSGLQNNTAKHKKSIQDLKNQASNKLIASMNVNVGTKRRRGRPNKATEKKASSKERNTGRPAKVDSIPVAMIPFKEDLKRVHIKHLIKMSGLPEKRKPGRPFGSTNKRTTLLLIPKDVPEKRNSGRPCLFKLQTVMAKRAKVSKSLQNNTAKHKKSIQDLKNQVSNKLIASMNVNVGTKRRRGRPSKATEKKASSKERNTGRPAKVDSIPVAMEEKRRPGRPKKVPEEKGKHQVKNQRPGRPKKVQPIKKNRQHQGEKRGPRRPKKVLSEKVKQQQFTVFGHDIRCSPPQYEQCQEEEKCQSPIDSFNSYTQEDPKETMGSSQEFKFVQVSQEDDNDQETECQDSYWEAPGLTEYAPNTFNNSWPQWVVETTPASETPPSPRIRESPSEQMNMHQDFLKELTGFKTQLISELAATRAEIQEGAQLMRSAISGVAAEIYRLGNILQPLISVITANVSQQGQHLFAPPPQDTPPDDTINFNKPSAQSKDSFTHQETVFANPQLPDVCQTEEVYLVKMEETMDNPQPCTHQADSTNVDSPTTPSVPPQSA